MVRAGDLARVLVLASGGFGTKFGGDYNDNFQLPDTESTTAQDLLTGLSAGAGTGAGLDGQVVWKAGLRQGHRRGQRRRP